MTESNDEFDHSPPHRESISENREFLASVASPRDGSLQSPILAREIFALILLMILCDLTIYRNRGYAGPGVLFFVAPVLLWLGSTRLKLDRSVWVLIPMLILLSGRLLWCGSQLAVTTGFVLLSCFAMSLSGIRPYMTQVIVYVSHLIAAGHRGLHCYVNLISRFNPAILQNHWFAVFLPLATVFAFATIFVMANPDLVKSVGQNLNMLAEILEGWIQHFDFVEVLFCLGVGWIVVGMLRAEVDRFLRTDARVSLVEGSKKSPHYHAYRNSLVAVIGLFAIYLAFEFQTLWFRTFPKGFHYSGYAHEGAAWLTVALGLATLKLSLIFRGTILTDPRLGELRILAWIWSVENLLVAMAVFNRLFIYIGFNGMTRMRVVGMLGVASVVGGFLLVLRKIARNRDFVWLIRRQLWTVSFAAYLYAVLPVDAFVNRFNVNRILSGDPAPCVQISVHPTSDEGLLYLIPLISCNDALIRDGVRALLNKQLEGMESDSIEPKTLGWTATQFARRRLFRQLKQARPVWEDDLKKLQEPETIEKFHKYAYQWY